MRVRECVGHPDSGLRCRCLIIWRRKTPSAGPAKADETEMPNLDSRSWCGRAKVRKTCVIGCLLVYSNLNQVLLPILHGRSWALLFRGPWAVTLLALALKAAPNTTLYSSDQPPTVSTSQIPALRPLSLPWSLGNCGKSEMHGPSMALLCSRPWSFCSSSLRRNWITAGAKNLGRLFCEE